ncbi:MAG: C25 family cysteine peptidase [Bacteroidales bacterium]|nr:C25 family cysteine peptidase [Bacteroidales bacterium]
MKKVLLSLSAKKILIFSLLILGTYYLSGQTPKINFEAERSESLVIVNDFESTRLQFTIEGLNYFEVKTAEGVFTELVMPGGYHVGDLGTPKLPAVKKLIEIPFGAEVSVKVHSYTVEEFRLSDFGVEHPLMPIQPSLRKDQDIKDVPFEYKPDYYSRTSFITPELASVEVLGVMRAQRIGHLTVSPVHYNPADGSIRVYNNIEVEIQYTGADEELTRYMRASTYSPYFDVVYNSVINPFDLRDIFDDHPDLTKYPVKMIIVSNRLFEDALQPFIEWKTIQGFEIIEAYTDVIGSTPAAIQSFIQAQYAAGTPTDPAPSFVVVVGAPNLLPASATGSNSNQVTDLYYGSVDGDHFPEMYVGRLSARTVQELQNQLDKILYYQQYEFTDPTYLNDVTLIAGQDSFWNPAIGQPTVHYGTQNYFNTANGFTNVNAYLNTYSGVYDNERISVSLINFTAHCSPTSWAGPYLTASDIHNLTNTGKYPLAIGNCCQSALFSHSESIGEAWVRAQNKGAVAYIGSAPNTHWFEDFYWAVGAFPITGNNSGYVPTVAETTLGAYDAPFVSDYFPVAATKFVGNLAITEAHMQNYPTHSNFVWYWQGYQTFGDPSTMIYLTEGSVNEVSHMPIVPIGLETYTVEALPGSYVAISKDGVLHGAALVGSSGEVDVPIAPILDGGDVTIVVTKPQFIPYIEHVPAAALEGPFVVMDHFTINDPHGKNMANYGESFSIDLMLKNVGADPSDEVTVTLTGGDLYIFMDGDNDPVVFDGMDTGDTGNTSFVADAFHFSVAMDIPDQHQTTFVLHITDGEEEWSSNLRITGNAPVYSINPEYVIDDSAYGDGNGRLDPGESAYVSFEVMNNGHADARQPLAALMADSPYFTIEQAELETGVIVPGESIEVSFLVHAHASAPQGTPVNMNVQIEDGHFDEAEAHLFIGQVPETIIGDGNDVPGHYPFYNWYKANRSQMLYHASEIGIGEKIITEIGMDITHVTSTSEHRSLPNFRILMKHTDMNALGTSFVNMSDAVTVMDVPVYEMASELGWHIFDIDNFEFDGSSNLIIEIIWGLLPTWCSFGDQYTVSGTAMPNTRAVYGYNDNNANPPYNGNSNILPNLHLGFAADASEDAQTVTFNVIDGSGNPLPGAGIHIGSLTRYSDTSGQTSFALLPGTYTFTASKEGFADFVNQFTIYNQDLQIQVVLTDDGSIIPGDANCDGQVDVLDVIAIVNFFLGLNPTPFCYLNADVNQDGVINILDVVGTINIFQQGKLIPYPNLTSGQADIFLLHDGIQLKSDGTITGLQFELLGQGAENLVMDLDLPDHNIVFLREADKLTTLIYSLNNTPLHAGTLPVVHFDNETETLNWGEVILANINAQSVHVNSHSGTTGISDLSLQDKIGFKAYPNPANNVLWVSFNKMSNKDLTVSFMNIHGQVIHKEVVSEQGSIELSINLEDLNSGIYLLRLNYNNDTIIEKIMVR